MRRLPRARREQGAGDRSRCSSAAPVSEPARARLRHARRVAAGADTRAHGVLHGLSRRAAQAGRERPACPRRDPRGARRARRPRRFGGLPGCEIQRRLYEYVRVTYPDLDLSGNDSQEARWLIGKVRRGRRLLVLLPLTARDRRPVVPRAARRRSAATTPTSTRVRCTTTKTSSEFEDQGHAEPAHAPRRHQAGLVPAVRRCGSCCARSMSRARVLGARRPRRHRRASTSRAG